MEPIATGWLLTALGKLGGGAASGALRNLLSPCAPLRFISMLSWPATGTASTRAMVGWLLMGVDRIFCIGCGFNGAVDAAVRLPRVGVLEA